MLNLQPQVPEVDARPQKYISSLYQDRYLSEKDILSLAA